MTGSIEVLGDTDTFRVALQAGHTYHFSATRTNNQAMLQDPQLALRGPDFAHITLHGGSKGRAEFDYAAAVSGTYYVAVSGNGRGDAVGAYQLVTYEAESVPPRLIATSPASGASDVLDSVDLVFTFDEPIRLAAANAVAARRSDGTARFGAHVGDDQKLVVDLAGLLPGTYEVEVPPTSVTDLSSNPFAGIERGSFVFTIANRAPMAAALSVETADP